MQLITRSSSGTGQLPDGPADRLRGWWRSGMMRLAVAADNRGTPFGPTPLRQTGVPVGCLTPLLAVASLPPGAPRVRVDRSRRRRCRRAFMTMVSVSPLTPLSFLQRTAEVFPEKPAIVYGDRSTTYREFAAEATRLARALQAIGARAFWPRRGCISGRPMFFHAFHRTGRLLCCHALAGRRRP